MEDNPSLTPQIRQRYRRLYSGVFYRRFVLGQWTAAEGRVYDFFDASKAPPVPEGPWERWYISCDYGTVNPASFGLWGSMGGVWYRTEEFYFDSRREGRQMTDAEYAAALRRLAGGRRIEAVIVDPSAASFLETLRRDGGNVRKADNDVLSGIRRTADAALPRARARDGLQRIGNQVMPAFAFFHVHASVPILFLHCLLSHVLL